jgi:type IV pilus biogenesis protein PilP
MVNKNVFLGLSILICSFGSIAQLSFDDRKAQQQAQRELLQGENELRALRQSSYATGLPSVISIAGLEGKKLVARLQLSNGNVSEFVEGDQVDNGISIASITPKTVIVKVGMGKSTKATPLFFVSGSQPGAGSPPPGLGSGVISDLLSPLPAVLVGQRPSPAPFGQTSSVQPSTATTSTIAPVGAIR